MSSDRPETGEDDDRDDDREDDLGHLCEGPYGPDHDDYLFGDTVGLQNLIKGCEVALREGEYTGDLGEFLGVRKVDTSWFEESIEEPELPVRSGSSLSCASCLLAVAGLLTLLALGVYKVIEWVFI